MAWDPPSAPTTGNPISKTWGQKVLDCLLWLYGLIGSTSPEGIPNGSAEVDSDSNGVPDNWEYGDYPGGTGGIDTSTPAHGAAAFYCTHPGGAGNGGRYWESDYVAISEDISPLLLLFLWATAAGIKVIVRLKYYDKAKSYLSSEDIYSSTSNPTTRTAFALFGIPPANARYTKIILIGGYTDTDVAGTVYFDGLQFDATPRTIYGDFTIAYTEGNNAVYADKGNAAIKLPKGFTVALLPITIISNCTNDVYGRYRISTTYSTVLAGAIASGVVPHSGTHQNRGVLELDISALSGAQTLYLQTGSALSGGTNYNGGEKADTIATYIRQ